MKNIIMGSVLGVSFILTGCSDPAPEPSKAGAWGEGVPPAHLSEEEIKAAEAEFNKFMSPPKINRNDNQEF